jgi:hypothetical protein
MTADRKFTDELSAEKEIVRRYFHEVLDQGKVELVDELFHPLCVMHRPGGTVVGINSVRCRRRKETFGSLKRKYDISDPRTAWCTAPHRESRAWRPSDVIYWQGGELEPIAIFV